MGKNKNHSQRSDVVGTAEFVQRVHDLFLDDPKMLMRAIAKHLQVVESTTGHVVH